MYVSYVEHQIFLPYQIIALAIMLLTSDLTWLDRGVFSINIYICLIMIYLRWEANMKA